jgi:hypothetical protein
MSAGDQHLWNNAISAICIGVEDFQSGSDKRLLSAVRNLHAGLLLLYKEKLRRLSPADSNEVLVRSKVAPKLMDGKLVFVGEGERTVSSHEVQQRFERLGIKADWKEFRKIARIRNEVEHFYCAEEGKAVREIVAGVFVLARAFVGQEFNQDFANMLPEPIWKCMVDTKRLHDAELAECRAALDAVNWPLGVVKSEIASLRCTKCGSELLFPRVSELGRVLECRTCRHEEPQEEFVERAIESYFATKRSSEVADSAPFIVECPACGRETYSMDDSCCLACECEAPTECGRCGCSIPIEELSESSYCSWCRKLSDDEE